MDGGVLREHLHRRAIVLLVCPNAADLRLLTIRAWVAMACTFPVYLAVPVLAIRKPFVPASPLGYLLAGERAIDLPTAAFPSFHVIWAVLVADLLTHTNRRRRWLWRAWAA